MIRPRQTPNYRVLPKPRVPTIMDIILEHEAEMSAIGKRLLDNGVEKENEDAKPNDR